MAKKPIGLSEEEEKKPQEKKPREKKQKEEETFEVMSTSTTELEIERFIAGCNERPSEGKREPATAAACEPVPPFTTKGLACLARLLSDQGTASGGVIIREDPVEKKKEWAKGFLSQFNPKGHRKISRPDFLYDFAKQVVDGESFYEPTIKL